MHNLKRFYLASAVRSLVVSLALVSSASMAILPGMASAQSWPEKPITLVVPFPPGGTTDVSARMIAQGLTERLEQTVVVDNRAGASGNIGSAFVARAKPDGYTLVVSGVGTHAANVGLYDNMPYDPLKDFTHITTLASSPNAIAVHPDFPARSLQDLIKLVHEKPDQFNYASPGNGSSGHLAFEMLRQKADMRIQHVPYKGAAQALTDVIGGQVPILIMVADTLKQHEQSGKLRILAVTSSERSSLFPDVPTVSESGYPGFSAVSWTGISGPAGLPQAIVRRLHEATKSVLEDNAVIERYAGAGNTIEVRSPEEFSSFVASEIDKWGAAAKGLNLAQ